MRHGVQDLEQSRGRSHSQLRGSPKVVGLLLSHRAMGGGGRSLPLPRSCGRLPLLGRWERRGREGGAAAAKLSKTRAAKLASDWAEMAASALAVCNIDEKDLPGATGNGGGRGRVAARYATREATRTREAASDAPPEAVAVASTAPPTPTERRAFTPERSAAKADEVTAGAPGASAACPGAGSGAGTGGTAGSRRKAESRLASSPGQSRDGARAATASPGNGARTA